MTAYERHCIESDFAGVLIRKYLPTIEASFFWGNECEISEAIANNVRDYLTLLGAEEYISAMKMEGYVNYYMIAWEIYHRERVRNLDISARLRNFQV